MRRSGLADAGSVAAILSPPMLGRHGVLSDSSAPSIHGELCAMDEAGPVCREKDDRFSNFIGVGRIDVRRQRTRVR